VGITINNVLVSKEDHSLLDGTLLVEIEGTVAGKGDYLYTGTLTFNGTSTADLKIGQTHFDLNLMNGTVVSAN
jgi:hypothetical protein